MLDNCTKSATKKYKPSVTLTDLEQTVLLASLRRYHMTLSVEVSRDQREELTDEFTQQRLDKIEAIELLATKYGMAI